MKQPTKEEITQNVKMFLDGKMNREDICSWAMNFIRNDERIIIDDVEAWHYLIQLGTMCVQIAPNEYLYTTDDLLNLVKEYT